MLEVLVEKGRASSDELMTAVWRNPNSYPDSYEKMISVYIHRLRKILKPPAEIRTVRSHGFELLGVPGVPVHEEPLPIDFPLTPFERKLLNLLSDGRMHGKEYLFNEMYDGGGDFHGRVKILDVWLTNIRRKLNSSWCIRNYRGMGWKLVNMDDR